MLRDLEREIWKKESHRGKELGKHIDECKKLIFGFLDFYNLTKYKEFAEFLCYYHDLGKIKEEFQRALKRNLQPPPHSSFSSLILLKNKEILEKFPSLLLFILKHHGNLKRIEDGDVLRVKNEAPVEEKERIDYEMRNWRRKLYKYINGLDITSKVNLVDTYGLFK
ncbi:CRISPR-associated endonuclease Cas3'', partial [Candidatus Woesearchaeota archaeon]